MNITIRVDDELGAEIEKRRGDRSKADFYREMIEAYLRADEGNVSNESLNKEIADLKIELQNKDNIIRVMDGRVKDLQEHNGFLISEFRRVMGINERLLMPAPQPKKWWEIWKR